VHISIPPVRPEKSERKIEFDGSLEKFFQQSGVSNAANGTSFIAENQNNFL